MFGENDKVSLDGLAPDKSSAKDKCTCSFFVGLATPANCIPTLSISTLLTSSLNLSHTGITPLAPMAVVILTLNQ